jgi:hypothetical protein
VITILKARTLMPTATAAAITRERCSEGFHVRVSLLEDDTAGVVIASFAARQLNEDLTTAFGGKDVIILK